jgi:hypothetical protein
MVSHGLITLICAGEIKKYNIKREMQLFRILKKVILMS